MSVFAEATDVTVADALRRFAPEYIAKYRSRMPPQHRKVLGLITRCKTGQLGSILYRCASCQNDHWVGRSCGNRHCPNCQKQKTQTWLAKQTARLLPVQHFVVTFTVPEELRPLLRAQPGLGYEAIFAAGSETIRTLLGKPTSVTRRLSGESFVRAFAQHILPAGFRKVRYYGFMSPNCKTQLADARWLVWLWLGWTLCVGSLLPQPQPVRGKPPSCKRCGAEMELDGITGSDGQWLWRRSIAPRGPPGTASATSSERSTCK